MNKDSKKQHALAAFQAQRPAEAQLLYREVCKADPNDADAWFMLGAISGQAGDYQEAAQYFRKATELMPASFAAWDNLGIALMYIGNYKDAEKCHIRALKINPQHFPAYNHLGNLMRTTNKLSEAINCFNSALRINPSYAEAHNNLGLALREKGDSRKATQHFKKAIELRPNYADACHNLGDTLKLAGNLDDALSLYQKALAINQHLPATHAGIAELYEELNYKDKALSHFETALRLAPELANALLGIARIKAATGHIEEAFKLLNDSFKRFPDNPNMAADLAALFILQRNHDDALRCIEPFLEARPVSARIALTYANLSRHMGHETQAIESLENTLKNPGLSVYQQEPIEHALARLYEASGEYEKAFIHCARANNVRPEKSDLERHLAEMESIKKVFSREFLASSARSGIVSNRPVFIVGMPRSGTSLVEQILASHPDVYGGGEITFLWEVVNNLPTGPYPESVPSLSQEQINTCAQHYLDRIHALSSTASRVTDKLPHNFLHIGLINMLFPGARIIHCVRDPRDTCTSIFFHKFNLSHIYARDLKELGTYYRHYEELMQHWKAVSQVPLLELRYEDLVKDFEHTVDTLLEFCGLPWNPLCHEFYKSKRIINTPSFDQASRPIYSSSIGRWKHYENHLKPLLKALSERTLI